MTRPTARRPPLLLGAVLFVVLVALPRTSVSGDTRYALPVAVSIVHERNLDLDEFAAPEPPYAYAVDEHDGHRYSFFPWATSLPAIPVVLALDALGAVGIGSGGDLLAPGSGTANQLGKVVASALTALTAFVLMMIVHDRSAGLGPTTRRRVVVGTGIVFALATPAASIASRSLWQHTPSMLATSIALLCAGRLDRRAPGWAIGLGIALVAGYAVRPTNALVAAAVLGWVALRHRDGLARVVLGGSAAGLPWLAVNLATWGRLLPPYHTRGGLGPHDHLVDAAAANLVSPARGLFVFVPVAVLGIVGAVLAWRTRHEGDGLELWCARAAVAYLVAVSSFGDTWYAGHTYGPRFLTDVLPLVVVLAIPGLVHLFAKPLRPTTKALLAVAIVWGLVVHLSPAFIPAGACWNEHPVDITTDPDGRVWSTNDPQVLANLRAVIEFGPRGAVGLTCEEYAARRP